MCRSKATQDIEHSYSNRTQLFFFNDPFFSKDVTFYKQDESINKEMDETFDIINWVSTGIVTIEYFLRIYAMGEAKDNEVVINIYKYLSICHKDLRIHGRYADGPKWISLNLSNGYLSISLFRYPP